MLFLRDIENTQPFDVSPIFAILHESIYCQNAASTWSAHRVRAEFPEFEIQPDRPVSLTGEMIYPWMFEDYEYLKPLREAAEILAAWDGWPQLYDVEKLAQNNVPCAASIYAYDMYVERNISEKTGKAIKGMRLWITSEYEHNGLRADGERLLDRLLAIARGEHYVQF